MTEFDVKKCKKQPFRGKMAAQKKKTKKGRNKGTLKKSPLKKKGATEKKKTQARCLFFGLKKGALESNMPRI